MARVLPELSADQLRKLRSRAEADVYLACRELRKSATTVLFSLPWIRVSAHGAPRDGETDFLVFDPDCGVLSIEVKGGGVSIDPDTGRWSSVDRFGSAHTIKDPFDQAKREKHAIRSYLLEQADWAPIRPIPTFGHAVLFPDLDEIDSLVSMDRPREIIGGRSDVESLGDWLESVFQFWAGQGRAPVGYGRIGTSVIDRLFGASIEVRPLLAKIIEDEEEERIRLTEEQSRLLRGLGRRKRAIVSGGAGTGKTLLALEKARSLAESGSQTLLLCYNRPLANHLRHCGADCDRLEVMSFHQLCDHLYRRADEATGRELLREAEQSNPGLDRFDVHFPHALALATECLDVRYDAIIVDEAQDFGEEYWLPVELLLRDESESVLFLFFDHNQAVYRRVSTFPIQDEPFFLTRNCRNTRFIHDAAYHYYRGENTDASTIEGEPVAILAASGRASQARRLHAQLVALISEEGVGPESIAVLVPSRGHRDFYDLLKSRPLPRPARWAFEEYGVEKGVRVDTVRRFKGLEASIVFFWGADEFEPEDDCEALYVTLSRAKSRLFLVGDAKRCEGLLQLRS